MAVAEVRQRIGAHVLTHLDHEGVAHASPNHAQRRGRVLVTGSALILTPSAAMAASCYNRGGYSFTSASDRLSSEIDVWSGSGCSGNPIGRGTAALVSSGRVQLTAWDLRCDNKGIWAYVHGYSTHPGGCGETANVRFYLSNVGTPHNWWLNVGGSSGVNANAVDLPS